MEEITGFLFFKIFFFLKRHRVLVPVQVSYCHVSLLAETDKKVMLVKKTGVCEMFLVVQYISNLD